MKWMGLVLRITSSYNCQIRVKHTDRRQYNYLRKTIFSVIEDLVTHSSWNDTLREIEVVKE